MTVIQRALVLLALFVAGCVSNTTMETRQVEASGPIDARRRAEAHAALAGEYYQRGNFAVALNEARQAVNDDPRYAPAYNMQALIFMQLREDTSARQAFEKALSIEPNNSEVLNNYGWFLCLMNENQRAMELLMRAANDTRYATPEKAFLSAGLCMRRQARNRKPRNCCAAR
jgi:type IV pilus assembly protein PilF